VKAPGDCCVRSPRFTSVKSQYRGAWDGGIQQVVEVDYLLEVRAVACTSANTVEEVSVGRGDVLCGQRQRRNSGLNAFARAAMQRHGPCAVAPFAVAVSGRRQSYSNWQKST
jgi:hypothetical protein